jgi:hypothetical protein
VFVGLAVAALVHFLFASSAEFVGDSAGSREVYLGSFFARSFSKAHRQIFVLFTGEFANLAVASASKPL